MTEKYSLQGFRMERLATLDPTPPPIGDFPGITTTQPAQDMSPGWGFLNGPGLP